MIGNFKLVIKLQTVPGGFLCISLVTWLTSILGLLQTYHNSDRHNFNCDPKPSDFIRQLCYNNYISAITKPHGLIPRDVVGITLLIVCGVYIIFTIYGDVTLRKRPGYRNENTNTFLCIYFIQVGFRMLFLVFMSRLVYSYEKIVLPDFFECDVNQTNSQTTPSPLNQTKITLTCHDLHHEEKSKINKAFIVGNVLFMVCSIFEVLHLWCKRETCLQYLIGHLEGFRADDSPQNGELKMKVKVDDLKLKEQNKQTGMPATESVRCQEVPQPRPSATSVASGVVSCPQTEDLRTSKEKAFLSFVIKYFNTTNPQSVEEFDRFLEYATALRIAIVGFSGGSLVITVKCESLMSLEELWKDYSSGHLGEVVQNCFVTEQILKELNLAELRLKTTIDIEEYKACKLFFEKDAYRGLGTSFSVFHPTSSTSESLQKNKQWGMSEQKTKIMETAKLEVPTAGHGRELEESRGRTETVITPGENRSSAKKSNASPPELNIALKSMSDLPETSLNWSNVELPVDILLLTVEECEFLSCFAHLKEPFKSYHISTGYVYFDQREDLNIALMRCDKRPADPRGPLTTSKEAILKLNPKVIFSVGACSGLKKVKLGDVVVSAKLITASYKTPPSRDIGKVIQHVAAGWKAPVKNADECNAELHSDGVVLSVSGANRDIIGQHPEAIAVEMEGGGGGVFAAAYNANIEWVVVKGIKDFADETQSSSKKWKEVACVMAASVVAKILNDPVIFKDWRRSNRSTAS